MQEIAGFAHIKGRWQLSVKLFVQRLFPQSLDLTVFLTIQIYGLVSFYIWYFKRTGFSFSIWVGEKGLMMTLISLAIKELAPIIILAIISVACNSLIPGGAGGIIGRLIIVVICLEFLVLDVLTIINHFNPSVKVPFQNKDK